MFKIVQNLSDPKLKIRIREKYLSDLIRIGTVYTQPQESQVLGAFVNRLKNDDAFETKIYRMFKVLKNMTIKL